MNYMNFLDHLPKINTNVFKKTFKIGTDCSGIDAVIHALNLLKIKYDYEFASDIDIDCKNVIYRNSNPKFFFDNIKTRDHSKLPKLDIYVAGFPCPSFSSLGKREGFKDVTRGTIFFECLETIIYTDPEFFILENVKGLITHDKGSTFNIILNSLENINKYDIYHNIYNTCDYGIPHSRSRIYIIGIKKNIYKKFTIPSPIPLTVYIKDILYDNINDDYYYKMTDHKLDIIDDLVKYNNIDLADYWSVDVNVSSYKRSGAKKNISPCLLAGRQGYYITAIERKTTEFEWLRLQGFPPSFIPSNSRAQIYKQAGNTMSINVLCFILVNIFNTF